MGKIKKIAISLMIGILSLTSTANAAVVSPTIDHVDLVYASFYGVFLPVIFYTGSQFQYVLTPATGTLPTPCNISRTPYTSAGSEQGLASNTCTDFSVVNGKLKMTDNATNTIYLCLYQNPLQSGGGGAWAYGNYYSSTVPGTTDVNYSCPDQNGEGYFLINLNGTNPAPPVPPLEPLVNFVNGLTCQTDYIPSFSGATWYDFGDLTTSIDVSTGATLGWVEIGASGFDGDRDIIVWEPSGTGSVMGTGSFTYPGTSTGILLDPQNKTGILAIDSIRGGNKVPYNIFQFFGTENIAYGKSGAFSIELENGERFEGIPMSSSGGVSVGAIANSYGYISTLGVQFLGRFNGFRIGRGELEAKTSCSINFNICEYSYNGQNLECQSRENTAGVPFAGCGVTGSGSVYGSGACVPLTDSNGDIIPPPPVTGGYVTLDSNGNIVGTVSPAPNAKSFFSGVFDCGIDTEVDAWYTVIGKALICPITVFGNFSSKVWDAMTGAQGAINQISQQSSNVLSGATMAGTGSTYTGGNLLVASLLERDAEIGSNKTILIFIASITVIFLIFVVAVIVTFIKPKK